MQMDLTLQLGIIFLTELGIISGLLRSMLRQSGSQLNKLEDANFSLKSLKYGLKSLKGDAYTLAENFESGASESQCLQQHVTETEEAFDTLEECVESAKETLQRIETFQHPCGGSGWEPIANFDYSDMSIPCPDGWSEVNDNGRGCGQLDPVSAAIFPVNELEYNEVCGRINGYSDYTLLAFVSGSPTLSDVYVEGVSLTHGPSGSESHIWTFASGDSNLCPCAGGTASPSFVGEDYFCERPTRDLNILWDGEDCVTELCCTRLSPPYFHAYLDTPTSDDIDARLITAGDIEIFFVVVTDIELYVRLVP